MINHKRLRVNARWSLWTPTSPKSLNKSVLVKSSVPYPQNMEVHTNYIILMTAASLIPVVLISKGIGAQEAHKGMNMRTSTIQKRENAKGQILLR